MTKLHSVLVTTTGRPKIGSVQVLRHDGRFLLGTVISATPGPTASMPAWAVTWEAELIASERALAMARSSFPLDARATLEEARHWHEIDEAHWRVHGYAPNHWES
ncbi:hypothetical protein H8A95_04705 [Bradyrhizobium sp. Pear76]|uniref:hypothetical protein n=1 Tax=Bradyrhizobium oropedii TaxID=1571201 RepID=UPI001E2B7840|nr:hypothetical protein [Bradyrhizobium oropedii]MCC8961638.1 hypothetical protein [Bradyrhizobium oropedii]